MNRVLQWMMVTSMMVVLDASLHSSGMQIARHVVGHNLFCGRRFIVDAVEFHSLLAHRPSSVSVTQAAQQAAQ